MTSDSIAHFPASFSSRQLVLASMNWFADLSAEALYHLRFGVVDYECCYPLQRRGMRSALRHVRGLAARVTAGSLARLPIRCCGGASSVGPGSRAWRQAFARRHVSTEYSASAAQMKPKETRRAAESGSW